MSEERIYELLDDFEIMDMLENYYDGLTDEFFIEDAYKSTDYEDFVRYSDEPIYQIAKTSLYLANDEIETLRKYRVLDSLSDEELTVLSAFVIARLIVHEENKHRALLEGEEWGRSEPKVEKYGSRAVARDHGYNNFMNSNYSSGYEFLLMILELYDARER